EILLDGRDSMLSGEESRALTQHLQACASCRRLQAATRMVREKARCLPMPQKTRGIAERALEAVRPPLRSTSFPIQRLLRPALAVALAAILLLAAGKLADQGSRDSGGPQVAKSEGSRSPKAIPSPEPSQHDLQPPQQRTVHRTPRTPEPLIPRQH